MFTLSILCAPVHHLLIGPVFLRPCFSFTCQVSAFSLSAPLSCFSPHISLVFTACVPGVFLTFISQFRWLPFVFAFSLAINAALCYLNLLALVSCICKDLTKSCHSVIIISLSQQIHSRIPPLTFQSPRNVHCNSTHPVPTQ